MLATFTSLSCLYQDIKECSCESLEELERLHVLSVRTVAHDLNTVRWFHSIELGVFVQIFFIERFLYERVFVFIVQII